MLITGTSDKIQFALSSSVTTTPLTFTANYNNYTSNSVTTVSNNGTSNNTTPVDIVASPLTDQQNELRYCSIYNADTVSSTIYILVYDGSNTRRVFQTVLGPGDMLQYQLEKGWEVLDTLGDKRNQGIQVISSTVRGTTGWRPGNTASSISLVAQAAYIIPLGRADRPYTSLTFQYHVTTAMTGPVAWAEMAVYTGPKIQPEGGFLLPYRAGFVDVNVDSTSGWLTTAAIKKTTIPTTGIKTGDLLFMVMGHNATGAPSIRSHAWGSTITDFLFGINTGANNSVRPSTTPGFQYIAGNQTMWWIMWQGT